MSKAKGTNGHYRPQSQVGKRPSGQYGLKTPEALATSQRRGNWAAAKAKSTGNGKVTLPSVQWQKPEPSDSGQ